MKRKRVPKYFKERTRVWKNQTVKEIMNELGKAGFSAKRLSEAATIYKKMLQDKKCFKFLTAAGALIAGGMRNTFIAAINNQLVDALVITGGSIATHDLIEAFGIKHKPGSAYANDIELSKKNIDRIYNVFLPNKGFLIFEKEIQKILKKMPQKEMSPQEFFYELGKHIKDKNSIIRACYEKNIPIFCPSFTDSILGFQVWMYSQNHSLKVNPQLDIRDFFKVVWVKNRTYGALILGGGVPKHFVAAMMQVTGYSLDYAIQITMDRPEHGGVSGASLKEAKSWKKVSAKALTTDVMCDITVAFPLIIASLL